MGKIVYLMGKSSTGKDTLYKKILDKLGDRLMRIVPYTTRPIRAGEQNGVEYFFTDEDGFGKLQREGRIIEERSYHTVHGLWRYFTVQDENLDPEKGDYIGIGTLESYESMVAYFGRDVMLPVLIELDDGVRLKRALNREMSQAHPKYEEMCRRFLADSEDFAEIKIEHAQIENRFYNDDLEKCAERILEYIDAGLTN